MDVNLYTNLSDEQLVVRAKSEKSALTELIVRYVCTVKYLAGNMSSVASDDLVQEGLMGLLNAVKSYNPEKDIKFSTYAGRCIKNKMISSLKRNSMISDADENEALLVLGDPKDIPETVVVEKVVMDELYDKISSALSEREWQVFQLFLTGMAYNQIALKLGVSAKTVNNAMQRVRRKLKSLLR